MAKVTNFTIEQGTTWEHGFLTTVGGTLINQTWVAASEIRSTFVAGDILFTFAPTITPDGVIVLSVAPADSSAWAWRTGVYDLEVTSPDGTVTVRVAEGTVTVLPEVTR